MCGTRTTLMVLSLALSARMHAADAASFAAATAKGMASMVREAAYLQPETMEEDVAGRREATARHRDLDKWFSGHGRDISLAQCKTEEDRRNYRDFYEVMANRDLLALPETKRRRIVKSMTERFGYFASGFAPALDKFLEGASPEVRSCIDLRLGRALPVHARYFGHNSHTTVAALYLPQTHQVYVNLNYMASRPGSFMDSFAHELWHHLLPPLGEHDNLWWEGFNEVVTEFWSQCYYPQLPKGAEKDCRTVEYPVQSAFASLYLGTCKQATLKYLAGVTTRDAFVEELKGRTGKLAPLLAPLLAEAHNITPARREQLEVLLSRWGWKEDDGTRISVANLICREKLDAEAMTKAFVLRKQLLMDLIQAISVVNLQFLRDQLGEKEILRSVDLPPQLRENLERVLKYSKNPRYQLANR